jgi:hypothetical protein
MIFQKPTSKEFFKNTRVFLTARAGAGVPPASMSPPWAKNPHALAGRLRRAQTFLRMLDIEIAFAREGRSGVRMIRMSASG